MYNDFHSNFSSSINNADFESANACLMNELGSILVRNRKDFVDMLNESDVMATNDMSDAQLVQLFINNAPSNKKLLLGASLLTNMHNKQMGFDGESEVSDDGVKSGYAVLSSYFADDWDEEEEKSNFLPIGLIAKGVGKLINNRRDKNASAAEAAAAAKQQMLLKAKLEREAIAKKKRQKLNTWLIGGGVVVVLGIIAVVIVKNKKR